MKKLLLGILLTFLLTINGYCAYTVNNTINPSSPDTQVQNFVQGTDSAGTYKTVFTPNTTNSGSGGGRLYAIYESNNDPSATHLVSCELYISSAAYIFIATTTALTDGTANGVPPKNLLSTVPNLKVDSNGNSYLDLSSSGQVVKCTYATSLTSTDQINLIAVGSDY